MTKLKGIEVTLLSKTQIGADPFGAPIYSETEITVKNVLVSPTASDDVVDTLSLAGRKAVYTLAIPKGDTHNWENREVRFFGERWRTFGIPLEGIEAMLPLRWNKKVMVERYE